MIALPLLTLWENKSKLLALFIIPIIGALHGLFMTVLALYGVITQVFQVLFLS